MRKYVEDIIECEKEGSWKPMPRPVPEQKKQRLL